jgi:rhamnogalacturonan endolyase
MNKCYMLFHFRFVMLKGSSGFYCYAILEHVGGYPALTVDEARITFKLNPAMSVSVPA